MISNILNHSVNPKSMKYEYVTFVGSYLKKKSPPLPWWFPTRTMICLWDLFAINSSKFLIKTRWLCFVQFPQRCMNVQLSLTLGYTFKHFYTLVYQTDNKVLIFINLKPRRNRKDTAHLKIKSRWQRRCRYPFKDLICIHLCPDFYFLASAEPKKRLFSRKLQFFNRKIETSKQREYIENGLPELWLRNEGLNLRTIKKVWARGHFLVIFKVFLHADHLCYNWFCIQLLNDTKETSFT